MGVFKGRKKKGLSLSYKKRYNHLKLYRAAKKFPSSRFPSIIYQSVTESVKTALKQIHASYMIHTYMYIREPEWNLKSI